MCHRLLLAVLFAAGGQVSLHAQGVKLSLFGVSPNVDARRGRAMARERAREERHGLLLPLS